MELPWKEDEKLVKRRDGRIQFKATFISAKYEENKRYTVKVSK